MSRKTLYREYRPQVFDEILGQEHIVKILKNQVASASLSHAYLFCGTRGTGKTTTARILAKAVNCTSEGEKPCGRCPNCVDIAEGRFPDVIEIDAASNNGVDNIRELRESVKYPPAVGKVKVYIIDEIHMLSKGAFNALLKTLEEPPENVIFILATTDPDKLPATVLSRCMRLDFRRVASNILEDNMRKIAADCGIDVTESALKLIAANADGSVRDSLSILEQCLSGGEERLDRDDILEVLGTVSDAFFLRLTDKVIECDFSGGLMLIDEAENEGKDSRQIIKDWLNYCRNLLIAKFVKHPENLINMSVENIGVLQKQADSITAEALEECIKIIIKAVNDARYSTQSRILLEVAFINAAQLFAGNKGSYDSVDSARNECNELSRETQESDGVESLKVYDGSKKTGNYDISADTAQSQEETRKPVTALQSDPRNDQNETENNPQAIDDEHLESKLRDQEELKELWNDVAEKAAELKASLSVIKKADLAAMNDKEFKIITDSDFVHSTIKRETKVISGIMEKITGTHRSLVCKKTESNEDDDDRMERMRDVADRVSQILGVDVKIK